MNARFQAGARIQHVCEAHGWTFCFIGGVANFRWGTPRLTDDLALTQLTGFGHKAAFDDTLLAAFEARIAAWSQLWADLAVLSAPKAEAAMLATLELGRPDVRPFL